MFKDVDPDIRLLAAFMLAFMTFAAVGCLANRYFDLQEKALDARIAEQLRERGVGQ